MPQHEKKQCLRCKTVFECKSGSILLCQCSKIELTAAQLEYINSKYNDCLCLSCLQTLRAEFNVLSHNDNIQKLPSGRIE